MKLHKELFKSFHYQVHTIFTNQKRRTYKTRLLKDIKSHINKDSIKKVLVKKIHHINFLEPLLRQSRGIGYKIDLQTEVKFLIGNYSKPFILFDIGANIGHYSIKASEIFPQSEIFSFEPSKASFKQLLENTKSIANINCVNMAIGDESKKHILYSPDSESTLASIYKRDIPNSGVDFNLSEDIEIMQLDDWVNRNNVHPDFLKIDVEGAELLVLRGAIKSLQTIKAVQFEFGGTAIDAKTYFQDYWNFFTNLNFKIFRYTPRGLLEINRYAESEEVFEYMNYVAIAPDVQDRCLILW